MNQRKLKDIAVSGNEYTTYQNLKDTVKAVLKETTINAYIRRKNLKTV